MNPPRQGLDIKAIKDICDMGIKRIIYLSCDPMTMKRDIKIFLEQGYQIYFLKGYDMFPHTWHIETLAVLTKQLSGTHSIDMLHQTP